MRLSHTSPSNDHINMPAAHPVSVSCLLPLQHYYYYHLWHPLDHVEAAWALGPKVPFVQKGMPIYTLIHERYRWG